MPHLLFPMPEFLPTILAQIDILGSTLGVVASVAISFVLITMVASYYRFQHIVELAEKKQPEEMGATADDVLRVQLARYLAGCARRGTSFATALIRTGNPNVSIHMNSPVVDAIKHGARRDDTICVFDEKTAVLIAESEPEDAESIIGRIINTIGQACPEVITEQMRAGIASYPGHGLSGKELISVALEGLDKTSDEKPILMPEIIDADAEDEVEEEDAAESEAEHIPEHEEDEADDASKGWRERRKDAVLDPVTGVLKPSVVSAYMQRLMSDLRYKKKKVALFCIGVNNMEHIARFHGEDAADDVLAGVSRILQEHLRADDLIGRHEKYAFLALVQCSLEEAELIGKRISTLVQHAEFTTESKKLKTTITLGVSTYPEHGRNLHHLYTAGQKVLDHSRSNDIRAYAVYDPEIHDKVPSKPMRSIKSVKA